MDESKRELLQKWISSRRINKVPDFITPELLANREFALEALRSGWDIFQHLPEELKLDKDVAIAKVTYCYVEHAIDKSLYENKDVLLASVLKEHFYLKYTTDELRNDKEVLLAAVSHDPFAIYYASEELKKDKELALVAVSQPLLDLIGYSFIYSETAFSIIDPSLRKDRDVVLAAVKANPVIYGHIDPEFKMDKEIAMYALTQSFNTYSLVPKELGKDKQFIMDAFDYACAHRRKGRANEPENILKIASKEVLDDREVILKAVKEVPSSLSKASYRLRKDKELAMLAFSSDKDLPFNFHDLSFTLQKDPDIILYLAKKRFCDTYFTKIVREGDEFFIRFHADAEKIKSNMKIGAGIGLALGAFAADGIDAKITQNPDDLIEKERLEDIVDADFDLKIDRQLLIDILWNNHDLRTSNRMAPDIVENDKPLKTIYNSTQYDLVNNPDHRTMAINQFKSAEFEKKYIDFSKLSDRLKADKEVAQAAVTYRPDCLQYVSNELKADKELVKQAYEVAPRVIKYASKDLFKDDGFMKELIAINGEALEYASDNLKSDKKVVMKALETCPRVYDSVSSKLKADKEVAIKTVSLKGELLESIDKKIRGDHDVVLAAVNNNGDALVFAPLDLRRDREIALAAVTSSGKAYRYISEELKADKELLFKALETSANALLFAPNEYRKDKEIVKVAETYHPGAVKFALGGLQADPDFML